MFPQFVSPMARALFARINARLAQSLRLNRNPASVDDRLAKAVAEALELRTLLASVGGYVYQDLDTDGVFGASEPGVANIEVDLYHSLTNQTVSTTTDSSGHYSFGGLDAYMCDYISIGPHSPWSLTTVGGQGIFFSGESEDEAPGPNFGLTMTTSAAGTVLVDQDNSGTPSAGDSGLGALLVFDDLNYNGVADTGEPFAYTSSTGEFNLTGLTSGPGCHAITVVPPVGWQTSSGGGTVYVGEGENTGISFVIVPVAFGSISGTAFDDVNADGANGGVGNGEIGLAGLTVTLVAPNGYSLTTTTNTAGEYTFAGLNAKTYAVSLTVPDNYAATTSQPMSVSLTGQPWEIFAIDLGLTAVPPPPPAYGSISGTIYNDRNGDASRDGDEPGLEGATVWATAVDASGNDTSEQFYCQTDLMGVYSFPMLTPGGSYRIAATQTGRVPSGAESTIVYNLDPADPHVTAFDAGLRRGVIHGTTVNEYALVNYGQSVPIPNVELWDDLNLNGVIDPEEPTATSDQNGLYALGDLDPYAIAHYIKVTHGTGYGPGTVPRICGFGGDWTLDEQLVRVQDRSASMSGTVFDDLNQNGQQDEGEPGLSGWEVYQDENTNGDFDPGEQTVTTDAVGAYTITDLPVPGCAYVRVKPPTGWIVTSPSYSYQVRSFSGESDKTATGVDFGVTINSVYEDVDLDSDNNDQIEPVDGPEDDIEDDALLSGKIIDVNSDDDDQNGVPDKDQQGYVANEDDLVELKLLSTPYNNSVSTQLVVDSGADSVRFYLDPNRATPVSSTTWSAGGMPQGLWVEAVAASTMLGGIRFLLIGQPAAATQPSTDAARATAVPPVSMRINGTTDGTPNSDDDFTIVSPNTLPDRPFADLQITVNGPAGLKRKVFLTQSGTGTVQFEAEGYEITVGTPQSVKLYGVNASDKKDAKIISAREGDAAGKVLANQNMTVIDGVSLEYSGNFQDRLATDPDAHAEPRGVQGWTRALEGEPDFDRKIRFFDPVNLRSHVTFTPVTVKKIIAGTPAGVEFLNGDAVLTQQVSLGDNAIFDGAQGNPGQEPIPNMVFSIGKFLLGKATNDFTGQQINPLTNPQLAARGIDVNKDFADRVKSLNDDFNALTPAEQIGVNGRNIKKRLSILEDRDPAGPFSDFLKQVRGFNVSYPGTLDKDIAVDVRDSQLMKLFKIATGLSVDMDFYAFDADALVGSVKGTIRVKP